MAPSKGHDWHICCAANNAGNRVAGHFTEYVGFLLRRLLAVKPIQGEPITDGVAKALGTQLDHDGRSLLVEAG
jgi:hypothetical protein